MKKRKLILMPPLILLLLFTSYTHAQTDKIVDELTKKQQEVLHTIEMDLYTDIAISNLLQNPDVLEQEIADKKNRYKTFINENFKTSYDKLEEKKLLPLTVAYYKPEEIDRINNARANIKQLEQNKNILWIEKSIEKPLNKYPENQDSGVIRRLRHLAGTLRTQLKSPHTVAISLYPIFLENTPQYRTNPDIIGNTDINAKAPSALCQFASLSLALLFFFFSKFFLCFSHAFVPCSSNVNCSQSFHQERYCWAGPVGRP